MANHKLILRNCAYIQSFTIALDCRYTEKTKHYIIRGSIDDVCTYVA